jgi:putative tryptophan/tyrosine transport system substrate-binding protein
MKRREFIAGLGCAAAWPVVARAQRPRLPVIGVLTPLEPAAPYVEGLRAGLRELGYADGVNVRIEYRWAEGKFERLPELATELVRLNANVIVAYVTAASLAAKKATATIPIVVVGVSDPVGVGLVTSLARPGGNVTGTSSVAADIVGKQFQLLKEIVPNPTRFAALWNPANFDFQIVQARAAEVAAQTAGVRLQLIEARDPDEFDVAFAAIDREGAQALQILSDPLYAIHSQTLVELLTKRRLAAISGERVFADTGGLMAYGPNYFDSFKRAATYVDKILKGTHPADLPVEQPTKFEFVVNRKTAKAFGIEVPTSILLRADEVIE